MNDETKMSVSLCNGIGQWYAIIMYEIKWDSCYIEYEMGNMTGLVGGGLTWELNDWDGMWNVLVKEFHEKLLVMCVVYIGDV